MSRPFALPDLEPRGIASQLRSSVDSSKKYDARLFDFFVGPVEGLENRRFSTFWWQVLAKKQICPRIRSGMCISAAVPRKISSDGMPLGPFESHEGARKWIGEGFIAFAADVKEESPRPIAALKRAERHSIRGNFQRNHC